MDSSRDDIITKLRKEINILNGFRQAPLTREAGSILDPLLAAFPNNNFPLGCVHEILCDQAEDRAAGIGFISIVLSSFIRKGVIIWISREKRTFPPALKGFCLDPSHIIFVQVRNPRDLQWVIAESLKCRSLSALVAEMPELDFNTSRKFQLAVEESRVTTFIIREKIKHIRSTASTARWKISHLPSISDDGLPGIGFPAWRVELLRLRNGRSFQWSLAFKKGRLEPLYTTEKTLPDEKRKTG